VSEQGAGRGTRNAMGKKILAWAVFLGCLFVLSLGSSRVVQISDRLLLPVRLLLLAGVSILMAREWWRGRDDVRKGWSSPRTDVGDRILQRLRRWYYGDAPGK
jgi:hypothetical protein